jgi:tetrahydromethanopterin S-methyltransferase subunit G
MLKKVFISSSNSRKAIAFFEEINKRKEEAKKKFDATTSRLKEKLSKKTA